MRFLVPCAVVMMFLAGCGQSARQMRVRKPVATSSAPSLCTVYDRAGDAEVTFEANGDVESACQQTIKNFGQQGRFWSEMDTSTATVTVCQMEKEGETLTVRDSGGAYTGNGICANLASKGFTDVAGDENVF